MKHSATLAEDVTGGIATSNIAGDIVLSSVLATLTDELDQVLVLTHYALGIPLAPLARDLKTSSRELQARVDRIQMELTQYRAELSSRLSGIHRAGQIDHYYPIIARLGLQNWFCARPGCPNPIIQARTGRPRKTCSPGCRTQLSRKQVTWQDQRNGEASRELNALDSRDYVIRDPVTIRNFMIRLMHPVNYPPPDTYWSRPNIHCRDRALLLLGLDYSIPVTVVDLCELDIDDVGRTSNGLEVKLYKKRKDQAAQYIRVPLSDDPRLCPSRALLAWRRVLARSGRTTGPLFIQLGRTGYLPKTSSRISSNAVAGLVWQALRSWGGQRWQFEGLVLKKSMPISNLLKEMMENAEFRDAVSTLQILEPRLEGHLLPDPCEPRNGRLIP